MCQQTGCERKAEVEVEYSYVATAFKNKPVRTNHVRLCRKCLEDFKIYGIYATIGEVKKL